MAEYSPLADIKRDHITKLVGKGMREDGRRLDEQRPLEVETGIVSSAEGSARVRLGNTQVLVGIKMSVGEPFADTPDRGVLTTNAELIPMASETFERGPPGEKAIEIARVVDRAIREGQAIDLKAMCLEPGKAVWILFVDIHVLDYDGNLFDAATIGALAALKTTIVPAKQFGRGEDFPLPLLHLPVACTAVKIDGAVLIDPTFDEELVASARLTVATIENGHLCAMQKGHGGSFQTEEVFSIIETARSIGDRVRARLPGAGAS